MGRFPLPLPFGLGVVASKGHLNPSEKTWVCYLLSLIRACLLVWVKMLGLPKHFPFLFEIGRTKNIFLTNRTTKQKIMQVFIKKPCGQPRGCPRASPTPDSPRMTAGYERWLAARVASCLCLNPGRLTSLGPFSFCFFLFGSFRLLFSHVLRGQPLNWVIERPFGME